MFTLELNSNQLVELNELLRWYNETTTRTINQSIPRFSKTVLGEIAEQIDIALWDSMEDDELWDAYVNVVGMDVIREQFMELVTDRKEMIQTLATSINNKKP